jgi:tryptophanyl-tRNA synthetase
MDQPKEPAGDVLYDLFALVATDGERNEITALYRRGGFGYGDIKKALADAAEKFFAEPRARRAELAAKPEYVRQVLADGAAKAQKKAGEVLRRAQAASGITGW